MAVLRSWSSSADAGFNSTVGAAPSIVSGGTYGERYVWPATTAVATGNMTITGGAANIGVRFIYSLASYSSASHGIHQVLAAGATVQYRVDLTSAGNIRLRNGALAIVTTGTQVLVVGTEYRVEAYRTSGGNATVSVYRVSDNTLIETISGAVGTTAVATEARFGNHAAVTGTLGSFTVDEIVITDTAAAVGPVPGTFGAPTGLIATPISTSQIDLAWNPVDTATGYDIERDLVVIAANQPGTTYNDTGLAPSTLYSYRVRAVK